MRRRRTLDVVLYLGLIGGLLLYILLATTWPHLEHLMWVLAGHVERMN